MLVPNVAIILRQARLANVHLSRAPTGVTKFAEGFRLFAPRTEAHSIWNPLALANLHTLGTSPALCSIVDTLLAGVIESIRTIFMYAELVEVFLDLAG
jgi:hypothetical protein